MLMKSLILMISEYKDALVNTEFVICDTEIAQGRLEYMVLDI